MSTLGRLQKLQGAVDVSASGDTGWLDMADDSLKGLVASFELATLTGGTSPDVTPKVEMSPDKSLVHTLDTGSALNAAGQKHLYQTTSPCFRWVRYSWVTTGSPSAATANIYIDA